MRNTVRGIPVSAALAEAAGIPAVEMTMREKKRINASLLDSDHMNMKPRDVTAASTGTPNSLINAPPATVFSRAMVASKVEEMKNPPKRVWEVDDGFSTRP
jgi:hypothetical protein